MHLTISAGPFASYLVLLPEVFIPKVIAHSAEHLWCLWTEFNKPLPSAHYLSDIVWDTDKKMMRGQVSNLKNLTANEKKVSVQIYHYVKRK